MGFGATVDEQMHDWKINKLSCCKDLPEEYQRLRAQCNPWFPVKNMLHISDIGCLYYTDRKLLNTKIQKGVAVDKYGRCIYYYLMELFGDTLVYDVVRIVLHDSLEMLFQQISPSFVPLSEYNQVFIADEADFYEYVKYEYQDCVVICSQTIVGLQIKGSGHFYVVNHQDDLQADLCYLAYRAGILW